MDNNHISELSEADSQILCNQAIYQKKGNWVFVDLGDGTGIQVYDNDLDKTVAGKMDTVGRVQN